ncbi:MAG: WYL domain-containing protein [Flavobacterium sp.]|nr:WYL domain-containing protein [Flavobacterium sp.]
MSITKNALIRYHALDKCFSNFGRKFSNEDLLKACNNALYDYNFTNEGIKRRQLFEDIKFMESSQGWEIPLQRNKEGRNVYYRYETKDFTINNQPINDFEIEKLKSALLVLSRFKGMPQFEWVNELILKLQQAFDIDSSKKEIISFDANEYLKNIHLIGDLFNAIIYQKVLELEYLKFDNQDSKTFEFHPYYLKQYNNRWFIIGRFPKYENLTHFALDRIVQFKEMNVEYIISTIDFNEYFEDVIGISKPKGAVMEKVILLATNTLKPYIITKPLHGSQKKISEDQNGYCFSLDVFINFELENLLLSYGETLKIMEPKSLQETIKNRLLKNLENYL